MNKGHVASISTALELIEEAFDIISQLEDTPQVTDWLEKAEEFMDD